MDKKCIDFTVLGLQRSGTNFVEQCLKTNLKACTIRNTWRFAIWKHAYDIESQQGGLRLKGGAPYVHKIFIHKHPYSWIESIMRKSVDIKKTHKEVCAKGTEDLRLKCCHGEISIQGLCELYNNHSRYWIDRLDSHEIFRIKYEQLIHSEAMTKNIIHMVADYFGAELKSKSVFVTPQKVGQSSEFNEYARKKYSGVMLETLTWFQVEHINR